MSLFTIDESTCNHCGLCVQVCAGDFVRMEKGGIPTPSEDAEEICIRCGHCVTVCPSGSFSLREMSPDDCPPVRKEWKLDPERCEHFLRYRRTVREYKRKRVDRQTLTRLIEMARYAPSGFNSQCAQWLVITERREMNRIAGVAADWMRWMLDNLPEIARAIRLDKDLSLWEGGADIIFQDAPAVIVTHAAKDEHTARETCTIALAYVELAATSLGLGCCWAGYLEKAATYFPPMAEALALPDGHQCFGAMMVGHPRFEHRRLAARKPPVIEWRT